ncbi:zinc-binding dehydrogenase [Streptomyces sp. SID8361]|uniref:NADP-dependent oxidoreductase n=1 Tax=Streptomyces TaxID=1883 RepID=UPI00081E8FB8|nr:NADP-dependent oxidoreductase [Streptomyces sp. MnatMP-M27]MYU18593.1 zinc-binding dehydrogenase [Streptomyces sp. SID8361]SCG13073.1 NADPH:quinone reductase [Streptomyces sp. MnatMP-M27]
MGRAVIYETFGGPEVLELREVPEPHAGPGEVRVRVTAAGLNPMDWSIASRPEAAARFGITVPSGFGSDLAGVIDEVGDGATGFAVGDRVYGGALGRAVADFVVVKPPVDALWHTPEGISDEVASTLPVAGLTAAAALAAIGLRSGDTVLVGGAAGGVGVFAVQLARLAGATVIGTASPGTFEFLRQLGAEPLAYGPGLANRVRALAPGGVTAATDLFGTETAEAALALGVAPERISTVAAGPNPPGGVRATGAIDAATDVPEQITDAILAGKLTVPIAAAFPVEKIRDAVTLQAGRHVHGKVVVTL